MNTNLNFDKTQDVVQRLLHCPVNALLHVQLFHIRLERIKQFVLPRYNSSGARQLLIAHFNNLL